MEKVIAFLKNHKLIAGDIDFEKLVEDFISEMDKGLNGTQSSLFMIPTYIEADNELLSEVPVVAIDAGGTNFRTTVISFDRTGKLHSDDVKSFKMPGLDYEISKEGFFRTIASYVKPLVNKSDRIGFCFSYATEIFPNKDGKLIHFCKEVQAPGVVGQFIGKSLLESLGSPDKKIVLLNDTVATLLAGKSNVSGKSYDSFMGFILGTGTNTSYIEQNINIIKTNTLDRRRSQIINIESGNFNLADRSDLDVIFDKTTNEPGKYSFEKMFSGGYFGGLCLTVLKAAADEGIFSLSAAHKLKRINSLSTGEVGSYAEDSTSPNNILTTCFSESDDSKACRYIINALIERSAKLVAANLAAVVLKTGKGKTAERPILITVEGTTYYKLSGLKSGVKNNINEYLSHNKKRYVEFTEVANSGLIGAAIAALTE
jgi:hexokinase